MSAELIIWKEAVTSNNLKEVGKAFEVFKGCKTLFVTKNTDKRAVVMFKNDKEQVVTVITTKAVNTLYRTGKITKAQMITLPVLRSDEFTTANGTKSTEPVYLLSLPAQGWGDMVTPQEITEDLFEALATL